MLLSDENGSKIFVSSMNLYKKLVWKPESIFISEAVSEYIGLEILLEIYVKCNWNSNWNSNVELVMIVS